jgi:hypothetical protein
MDSSRTPNKNRTGHKPKHRRGDYYDNTQKEIIETYKEI